MNCSEFDRWLDEGSPESGRAAATLHAGGCARCARTLEAERAVAAALRAQATTPSMEASVGFVARVMARVEGAAGEVAAAREGVHAGLALTGAAVTGARASWWTVFASDPISIVSVTLGVSLAVLASWRPEWITNAVIDLATRWLSLAATVDAPVHIQLDPLVWLSLGIAASPFLAWGITAGWRRLEPTLVLITRRPGA